MISVRCCVVENDKNISAIIAIIIAHIINFFNFVLLRFFDAIYVSFLNVILLDGVKTGYEYARCCNNN